MLVSENYLMTSFDGETSTRLHNALKVFARMCSQTLGDDLLPSSAFTVAPFGVAAVRAV